jgi:hypothetical protein
MAIVRPRNSNSYYGRLPLLKKLFWLYFLLLIFEGALRKWVAPQLSAPLLIIRDPLSIYILWEAYRSHKWPAKWSLVAGILTVAIVALFLVQILVGDNPWIVGLYGLRSYLLPFPVAFIMGENLNGEDLRRFGVCALLLLLPLTGLEVAQYLAPPGSSLNNGAYAGAGQISYVGGHVRASGTFSYVTGPIGFNPLAAAFIFYGLVKEKFISRWLLWAASFALILSVPVIGSRTLVFELAGVVVCVGIGAMLGVSQFGKTLRVILPVLTVIVLVSLLPVFSEATSSLLTRFTQAANAEGGSTQLSFVDRTFGTVGHAFDAADFGSNWIGIGMGRGAAAMAKLLTDGEEFLAGEDEFSREINEFGPLPGLAFSLFRLLLAAYFVRQALASARNHEPLAFLLAPMMLSSILLGVLEQPTEQGFMVIGVALSISASKLGGTVLKPALIPMRQWNPVRKQRVRTIAR